MKNETLDVVTEKKETIVYAGFWDRAFANVLDGIIVSLPLSFFFAFVFTGNPFSAFLVEDAESPVMKPHEMAEMFFLTLYAILLPIYWSGMTIGKKLMGISIARIDGEKITLGTMVMRNVVAAFLYAITLLIGLIVSIFMVIFREDKRSLHDFVAKTCVIKNKE